MIKEFLDWFNENKLAWGGVSDKQLETLIMAHIKPWPIIAKLKFKLLVDGYRESEQKRKLRASHVYVFLLHVSFVAVPFFLSLILFLLRVMWN